MENSPTGSKTILVIDDDGMIRVLIKKILRKYKVLVFENGQEVLEWLKQNPGVKPDLVISDYNMSGLSGVETCQQIRAIVPQIKSLLMSATILKDLNEVTVKNHFDGCIAKPFTIENVRNLVNRLLSTTRSSKTGQKSSSGKGSVI